MADLTQLCALLAAAAPGISTSKDLWEFPHAAHGQTCPSTAALTPAAILTDANPGRVTQQAPNGNRSPVRVGRGRDVPAAVPSRAEASGAATHLPNVSEPPNLSEAGTCAYPLPDQIPSLASPALLRQAISPTGVAGTSSSPQQLLQCALAAAQHHGTSGPAGELYVASVAATAVAQLQACTSSSFGPGRNRSSGADAAASNDGDGGDVLRQAAAWLAAVAADPASPEPAARAALSGLATLLPAALDALMTPPGPGATRGPGRTPTSVSGATAHATGVPATVGGGATAAATSPVATAATAAAVATAAAAILYDPSCAPLRLTAVALSTLYGRCADATAIAAAAGLLGACLQLQVLLPLAPGAAAAVAADATTQASSSAPAMRQAGCPGSAQPSQCPTGLPEFAGWAALLELARHPHPRVRTACLGALQQGCEAAAGASAAAALLLRESSTGPSVGPLPHRQQPRRSSLDPAAATAAYGTAAAALEDDAEEPRAAAISLVSALAQLVPDLPYGTHFGVAARLVDDAFMRLCGCVADPQRGLRLQALRALEGLHAASLRVKLQALSKKTTLRVAAPVQPAGPATAAAATAAPDQTSVGSAMATAAAAAGMVVDAGGSGARPGGKRGPAATARGQGQDVSGAEEASGSKRLTTSAWEPQSWLQAAANPPRHLQQQHQGAAVAGKPGEGAAAAGGGGGGGGASDDLTLLENAVGAFVVGSEDEHWEVRAATLETMTRLAEHEYRAAAAAAAEANAGDGGGGGGGPLAAAAAGSLSVRIGGIGGSAGSRIAAGGGNVEAAAAVCEALVDALLDELPEVRRVAAGGVVRLLKLEVAARRQAAASTPPESQGPQQQPEQQPQQPQQPQSLVPTPPSRRGQLPALLSEEVVRGLAMAARDTDGATRREVLRALACLRPSRPGLLRELVQVLRRCIAANPTAPDWREASRTAWCLGSTVPEAVAASMRDLAPPAAELAVTPPPQSQQPQQLDTPGGPHTQTVAISGRDGGTGPTAQPSVAGGALAPVVIAAAPAGSQAMQLDAPLRTEGLKSGAAPNDVPGAQIAATCGTRCGPQLTVTAGTRRAALRARVRHCGSDTVLRLLVLAGGYSVNPATVAAVLPAHVSPGLLRAVQDVYGPEGRHHV